MDLVTVADHDSINAAEELRQHAGIPQHDRIELLTQTISSIGWSLVSTNPRAAVLSPLFAFVPAFAVVNYFRERAFIWYWGQKNRTVEPEGRALNLRAVEL